MGTGNRPLKIQQSSRGRTKRFRLMQNLVFLAVIVAMVSVPLVAAPPARAAADVSLSITSGSPGSSVTVSGTGFTDGDTYSIMFAPGTFYEQTLISNAPISGTTFSQLITIPPAPWALHTIRIDTNRGTFLRAFQIVPEIELHINAGYVGDTIIVTGDGFRANANVNILFNNTVVTTVASDVYGTLAQGSFQVPVLRSGSYNVNGNDSAAASSNYIFTIRSRLLASATEGPVGEPIVLTGSGFDYNSGISFYWDNQLVSSSQIVSNSTGNFTGNFSIPVGTVGTHTIRASDFSGRIATVNFIIVPSIILNPGNSAPGNTVTITGKGFRPNTSLTVTYNGITVATQPQTVITDASGSFSATFIVPSGASGSYTVRASDGAFAATATFNITLKIELTPSNGNVGTELQVKGTGFTPSGSVSLNYDAQNITTVNADTNGSFMASFKVPASKAGVHNISARDLTVSGLVVTATFTMESTPPPKPNLLAPEPGSQASITPKFSWSGVTDPSGVTYSLQVARDAAFSNTVLSKQGLTTPEYTVIQAEAFGLTKKTSLYYWRVKAIDGAGNENDWTSPGAFYTQDSTPPPVPSLLSPPNDSQAAVRPAFDWSDVSDPSGVTYSLQIARDTGFSQLVLYKQGLNTSNYQTTPAEQFELTKKTSPYYWRVKAIDGAVNESEWTSPFTFYTQDSTPPPAPVALRPEQGSHQDNQTFFDWTDVTDPSNVTYTLQVSQDPAFSRLVVVKEGLQTSEYKLSKTEKLNSSTGNPPSAYYWRVKAIDGAGNGSSWSNSNEFTVRNFLQSGWPVYTAIAIGGLLLLALGVFIGLRFRPKSPA